MKKRILTLIFLGFNILGWSQNKKSIYPNFIGLNLNTIENNLDWKVLKKSSGDLNKDGLDDFALILESNDSILEKRCSECKLLKNKPRIIIVLLNQNEKKKVIIQNNEFIARGNEGGMCSYLEPQLSIKNGLLSIYYEYTRSNVSYTFEYNDCQMENIIARIIYGDNGFNMDEYDFKKGEVIRTIENVDKDSIEKTKFNLKTKTLSEYKKMGSWEVLKNRYL